MIVPVFMKSSGQRRLFLPSLFPCSFLPPHFRSLFFYQRQDSPDFDSFWCYDADAPQYLTRFVSDCSAFDYERIAS